MSLLLFVPELAHFVQDAKQSDYGQGSNDVWMHLLMPLPTRTGRGAAAFFGLYVLLLWAAFHIAGVIISERRDTALPVFAVGGATGNEQERNGDQASHRTQYTLGFLK